MKTSNSPTPGLVQPLSGLTGLVTGGLSGIGRSIVLSLAQAGADLAILDIGIDADPEAAARLKAEVAGYGRRFVAAAGDVSDVASVRRCLNDVILPALGRIDILVNNAGLIANFGTLESLSREAWDRELAVNLGGAFTVSRELVPAMAARGWGRVVTLSSCAAWTGSPVQVGYGPTKAGLIAFSHTIARAYAPRGVTANAVLPGFVSTPLINAHFPADERRRVEAAVPIRRFVTPEEVAATVTFLAGPAAAGINGACIKVDGGMALSAGNIDG